MQRVNPLCPTIRNKHRKIGRNEPCPCGRMHETKAFDEDHTKRAVFTHEPISNDPGEQCFTVIAHMPNKYKHCCGNVVNQRPVARAKRNIADVIRSVLGFKKDRRSMLQKLAAFFKKK